MAAPAAPPAPMDMAKARKTSLIYGCLGLAVFVAGFFIGFAALIGAVLGVYGAQIGFKTKYAAGMAIGITAAVLNAGFYIIAIATK